MTTFDVSNATQLQAALASAQGGDKILLAAGSYGAVSISGRQYSSSVKIEASSDAAVHLDGLKITNSSNLAISGLDLGRALLVGEASYTALNSISDSSNIRISNVTVHGSLDGDPSNDGRGFTIWNGTNVEIANSDFTDLSVGLIQQRSSYVSITGNVFHKIQSDGIDSSAMHGVSISGNTFRDFSPKVGDHPDAIQFFNTNQPTGSDNITIKGNVIFQGDGTGTQGIFVSDPGMGYSNVLIQNNLVYSNDQYNGVAVNGAHGLQILGNTVISRSDDTKAQKIYVVSSDDVLISGNVAEELTVAKDVTAATVYDNLNLSQNPDARNSLLHVNAPTSVTDLILPHYGYQIQSSDVGGNPVSSALGSLIDLRRFASSGQALHSATLDDARLDGVRLDAGTTTSEAHDFHLFADSNLSAPAGGVAEYSGGHSLPHFWMPLFNHFEALP